MAFKKIHPKQRSGSVPPLPSHLKKLQEAKRGEPFKETASKKAQQKTFEGPKVELHEPKIQKRDTRKE